MPDSQEYEGVATLVSTASAPMACVHRLYMQLSISEPALCQYRFSVGVQQAALFNYQLIIVVNYKFSILHYRNLKN